MAHLGDEDVLRLDVPVEAVVQVAEVDRLQCLPHDALQQIYHFTLHMQNYFYSSKNLRKKFHTDMTFSYWCQQLGARIINSETELASLWIDNIRYLDIIE